MAFPYNAQLVRDLFSSDSFKYISDNPFEDAFELYHRIQEQDANASSPASVGLPALGHALAGSAGTAISHLLLYPLDLSITRLQVQKQLRGPSEAPSAAAEADIEYKSIFDAVKKIYNKEGGLKAFYAGCLTDTAKSIVDAFLFFLLYTFLRQRRLQTLGKKSLPVPDELRIGIASGAFAKFVTTPIQQIVTRKQTAAMVAARDPTSSLPPDQVDSLSIKDIALQIRSERGITGFWAGYRASLILTLNPGLTFLFHNLLSRLLPASKRSKPGPQLTFLIAALSKAAASATMYPFSLAKTRAQVSASRSSPVAQGEIEKSFETIATDKESIDTSSSAPKTDEGPVQKPTFDGSASATQKVKQSISYLLALVIRTAKAPSPLIHGLSEIYKEEGVLALYAGLQGEVLKGFLGHGLTMLLKERIHLAIVGAYFLALKAAKKSRENSKGWKEDMVVEMGRVARAVGEGVEGLEDAVKEGAEKVVDKIKSQ
ncbi:Mitochondrial substrate carrier family protein Q [Sphaceloma murrayae]|uniref:Mitochondrial substrate carrier family protein Q n=1 Tax=Sphaceloma murrayae TaxID=2082308 RepID=A0A2K1QSG4_9PEZI|nr:Mitochondrial substrate carrier family protein Q [Sphaceloma murrayae]